MNWVEIVAIGIGAMGTLGAASANFSKNRSSNLIRLQEQELTITKEARDRLAAERVELTQRLNQMEGRVQVLTDLAQQTPALTKLASETLRQHNEVIGKLTDIAQLLIENSKSATK